MVTAGGTVPRARRPRRPPGIGRITPPVAPQAPAEAWDAAAVDELRARDYARLDGSDQVYLDEASRGITADEMARAFELGHPPTPDELAAIMPGKALGAVRVSLGIATTERDIDRLTDLLLEFAE